MTPAQAKAILRRMITEEERLAEKALRHGRGNAVEHHVAKRQALEVAYSALEASAARSYCKLGDSMPKVVIGAHSYPIHWQNASAAAQ